jgi:hypothetical protein
MTAMKNIQVQRYWQECGETKPLHKCANVTLPKQYEKWYECPSKKWKIELPYDQAILLLGTHPKEMESICWENIHCPMFVAALFTIVEEIKTTKCPSTDE